jgi:hypothetical protein
MGWDQDILVERLKALDGLEGLTEGKLEVPNFSEIKAMMERALSESYIETILLPVEWEEADIFHVAIFVYSEGKMPISFIVGKLRRAAAKKWLVQQVHIGPSMLQGPTFREEWSPPFKRQRDALDFLKDLMFKQGEELVQQGTDMMMGAIMRMGSGLEA